MKYSEILRKLQTAGETKNNWDIPSAVIGNLPPKPSGEWKKAFIDSANN